MNALSSKRLSPLFALAAFVLVSFSFPSAAYAGAITTTYEAMASASSCSGSYIQSLAGLDTAYLPGDYATPGKYCIQTTRSQTYDCSGNTTGPTYTYALYSGSGVSVNGGASTNTCKVLSLREPFFGTAVAYAASSPVALGGTGSRTNVTFSTIVYLVPTASLSGGTTVYSGGSAYLTWGSNLVPAYGITYGSCTGTNFPASGTSGSLTVYPTQTTTYTATCSLNSGANASASQTVYVIPPLSSNTVSCSASPTSASTGQSVTWSSNVTGGVPPFTYQWSGDEGVNGQTGSSATVAYNSSGTKSAGVTVTDSSGTPGYTSIVNTRYQTEVCSGPATSYATPPDSSGYGPGIWPTNPVGAYQYAPPDFYTNPQNYCVEFNEYTTPCNSGTCIPNSTWSYTWYSGSGVAYPTGSQCTGANACESWNFAFNTNPGTPNATVSAACSNTVSVTAPSCTETNTCGQSNTGQLLASGSCTVSAPPLPSGYGTSCTSAANACGQTNTGSIQCNGSCSASTPANPSGYGNSCTSAANACGQTNTGSIQCNGSCSASTPANPSGYGNSCTSAANACGQTNTGSIQCNGSCSASAPSNTSCPAPTASLSVSPGSVPIGNSSTLSWSSTNAYSCTGTNFSTGGNVSGSVSVSPSSGTTYSIVCTSSAGATASQSTSISVSYPDLTAGSASFSNGSPTVGTNVSLSANVSNIGAATANNFPNMFQIATDQNFTNTVAIVNASTVSSLASNSSTPVSSSYLFNSVGTFYVRACANFNSSWGGSIAESNNTNNCGAGSQIVVSNYPPDLTAGATTLSPSSAAANQSIALSADVSNIGTGSASNFPNMFQIATDSGFANTIATVNATTVASLAPNASAPVSASYSFASSGTFYVRACANFNSSWGGSIAESNNTNNCGAAQSISIATPTVLMSSTPSTPIFQGSSATLTWNSQNAVSCTGNNFPTPGNPPNGSATVSPSVTTTYTITCNNGGATPGTSSAQVTVVVANLTLTASPTTVRKGDATTLTWAAAGQATSCALSGPGFATGGTPVALSGSQQVVVTGVSTYTFSCAAGGLTPSQSVTVGLTPNYIEF